MLFLLYRLEQTSTTRKALHGSREIQPCLRSYGLNFSSTTRITWKRGVFIFWRCNSESILFKNNLSSSTLVWSSLDLPTRRISCAVKIQLRHLTRRMRPRSAFWELSTGRVHDSGSPWSWREWHKMWFLSVLVPRINEWWFFVRWRRSDEERKMLCVSQCAVNVCG